MPDPDCDWHSTENHCAYLCKESERGNELREGEDEQEFYSSEGVDDLPVSQSSVETSATDR